MIALSSMLVFISFCTLGNKCFFGTNDANWAITKLGQKCTLNMKLYMSAMITAIIVCIFIMFKQLLLNIISNFL